MWYRCHRLLRDALGRSPGTPPDAAREVLRRAARWFEEHDRIDDAVRCRQDAGDDEAAADLLAAHHRWFVSRGWAATLLALGERLPEAAVRPALAVALAYAADASGNRDRIVHWLDVCDRGIGEDTVVPDWRSPRAAEYSLRGLFGTDISDPAQAVELCERSLALETAAGNPGHPIARVAVAEAYGLAGRFGDAVPILAESWRNRGQGYWSAGVDLQVGGQLALFLLALESFGELDRLLPGAVAAADAAEHDWREAAAAYVVTIRLVEGRRAYQRGDRVVAADRLGRALRLAELSGRVIDLVIAHLFLADAKLAAGDRAAARTALARAREAVDNEPVPPFVRSWLERAENRIGRSAARTAAGSGALAEELTDRELSILRMLPGTATQREIGAALFLSINTVKAYNKSLYRKLGVAGRQDAVRAARGLRLI